MRPNNNTAATYQPGDPPNDPANLQRFLNEELTKIKAAIDAVADGFDPVVYAPPAKPRAGMRRYADGTSWNPGSGAGLYRFDGVAWVFLG